MINIRRSNERGHADHGWLNSHHTFSFADYYDPAHKGFRSLRVINDDRVSPGQGFGTHPHRDMEIFSYVLEGALQHKDSLGTGAVIKPGELQRMTAGTGITHSEFNHSSENGVHFLQIWIIPARQGLKPGYEQRDFSAKLDGSLRLVASSDGRDKSVLVHQDADLYVARPTAGAHLAYELNAGRLGWIQVARGGIELNGQPLKQGDGAAIDNIAELEMEALEDAELLLFDMAANA
jgi:redox-sensitive bicupin YhaK (pirin superfamily)